MKTKLTELLNIEYPIIQGAMAWVSEATLVAAVAKCWCNRCYRIRRSRCRLDS